MENKSKNKKFKVQRLLHVMLHAPCSKFNERGVTLYLAVMMVSIALATSLFVSTVFVQEYKITKEATDSLTAIYAADAAMEYTMYYMRSIAPPSTYDQTVPTNTLTKYRADWLTGADGSPLSFGEIHQGDVGFDQSVLDKSKGVDAMPLTPKYFHLPVKLCTAAIGYPCDIKVVNDVDKNSGINGCPSTSFADDCTYIITKGSYGGTNRAMESIYENL